MAHTTTIRLRAEDPADFRAALEELRAHPLDRSWRVDETYYPRSRAAGCIYTGRWTREHDMLKILALRAGFLPGLLLTILSFAPQDALAATWCVTKQADVLEIG